ncbi:MAG: ABC transporter permease [Candidatus Pristimantibacillus sp.]
MYLALREMRFAKTRYSMIVIIMLLVSFLVLFVTGLAQGLSYANAASIKNMDANYFVLQQDSDHRFGRSQVSDTELQASRSVVGKSNATALNIRMATITEDSESLKSDVTLFAIDMKDWLAPNVVEGQTITNESSGQVLVDMKLKESGIELGSIVTDQMTGSTWKVSGFVDNESYSHTPTIFMNEKDWLQLQALMPASGTDSDGQLYNTIAVKADSSQAAQLQSEMPNTEVISKSDAVSAVPGYKEEQGSLLMMIAFLFVISALVLAVFFYVITIQKTSQFGVLKAIGTKTSYLVRNVMGQVLLLSVGSLIISLILIQIIISILPASMPFQLDLSTMILVCVLFIAMSLIGSLLSVVKVARTDALDAIGRASA